MDFEAFISRIPEKKDASMRPYAEKDIVLLAQLVERFVPELPNYAGIKVDKERISYILRHHLKSSQSIGCWVLVDDDDKPIGGMLAFVDAGLFTFDKIATDKFLFILPGWRTLKNANRLIGVYKAWAMKMGAVIIMASSTGGYREDEVSAFYKRNGFERTGSLYHIRTDETALVKQLMTLKG